MIVASFLSLGKLHGDSVNKMSLWNNILLIFGIANFTVNEKQVSKCHWLINSNETSLLLLENEFYSD